MIKKQVSLKTGKKRTAEIMKNGKREYKRLVGEADELGRGNPFGLNAYFAYVFVGVYLGAEGELSPDDIKDIMRETLLTLKPLFGMINLNTRLGVKTADEMYVRKYLRWCKKHGRDYPHTWKMTAPPKIKGKTLRYRLHSCPICELCERQGIAEIMPPLCELDELMFAMMHGRLIRRHTISSGGGMCDYTVIGDKNRV